MRCETLINFGDPMQIKNEQVRAVIRELLNQMKQEDQPERISLEKQKSLQDIMDSHTPQEN